MRVRRFLQVTAAASLSVLCAVGTAATVAWGQGAGSKGKEAPLLHTTFAKDEEGWKTFGDKTKVTATDDDGKRALKFDYTVEKGTLGVLFLPVSDNEIAPAKSIRFSVKADKTATLVCVLQEKGGGRYIAIFQAPGGEWQSVALAPSDFVLGTGEEDPTDPDGKLDLDQVEGVGITDVGQIAAQGDTKFAETLGVSMGEHHLLLGEFTVGRDPLPATALPFGGTTKSSLDTFLHPQVGWIALGGASLTLSSQAPLPSRGLKMEYQRGKGLRVGGAIRQFPRGFLVGKDRLDLTLASEKPITLVVQLEGSGGAKHNVLLSVPGGGKTAQQFSLPFSSFKPAQDSKGKEATPPLDDVQQIILLDITALLPAGAANSGADATVASGSNTLWLTDLRAATGAGTGTPPVAIPVIK